MSRQLQSKAATIALVALKLALIGTYLAGTNRLLVERVAHIGLKPGLVVFAAVWMVCLASMLALAFHARTVTRIGWSIAFFLASTMTLSHALIASSHLGLSEFEQLLGLIGFAGNLVGFHDAELLQAVLWSLLGVVALNLPPFFASPSWLPAPLGWPLRNPGLMQLLPVLAIAAILYLRGGEGSNGFPGQYNTAAFAFVLAAEKLVEPKTPARRDVALRQPERKPFRHIVLVMDESVRGDYVDINVDDGVETGLRPLGPALFNFGIAASAANCSSTSNASVRFGVTRDSYLRDLEVNPSFWRYASQAGYRTIYIDAQRNGGKLHNFMDERERGEIDEFVQIDAAVPLERKDAEAGRMLNQMLKRPQPSFVYINKVGCHFPYEGKYPADARLYAPTMQRTSFSNEVDPDIGSPDVGSLPASAGNDASEARWRQVNSYRNCVAWNTREFFRELLADAPLEDTLILYTADHGQNFHEDGDAGAQTHCTIGPAVPGEGRVPLVAITRNPALAPQLRAAASDNRDKASHFNLYPTVLRAMGYSLPATTDAVGTGVLEPGVLEPGVHEPGMFEPDLFADLPDDNQRFLSTYFVRFGREPVWNPIGKPAQLRDGLQRALAGGSDDKLGTASGSR